MSILARDILDMSRLVRVSLDRSDFHCKSGHVLMWNDFAAGLGERLEFSAFPPKSGGYAHFIKGGLVRGNSIEHRIQLIKHDEHKHKMIQNIIYIRPYSADVYRECNIREQLLTTTLVTLWLKCVWCYSMEAFFSYVVNPSMAINGC